MGEKEIVAMSAVVVALTQFFKWAGVPDRYGPLAAGLVSVAAVIVWAFDHASQFGGMLPLSTYVVAFIAVLSSAAGVYGFTRATGEAMTRMRSGPGDSQNPVV